ncbi:hypothetical protein LX36DRAFT_660589 [Colletotrichum falcatum]|nr:hypothetical protein LX36DRAFT_660589 [Colletotrichum falcatum]
MRKPRLGVSPGGRQQTQRRGPGRNAETDGRRQCRPESKSCFRPGFYTRHSRWSCLASGAESCSRAIDGSPVVIDNPNVGENVWDHPIVCQSLEANDGVPSADFLRDGNVILPDADSEHASSAPGRLIRLLVESSDEPSSQYPLFPSQITVNDHPANMVECIFPSLPENYISVFAAEPLGNNIQSSLYTRSRTGRPT